MAKKSPLERIDIVLIAVTVVLVAVGMLAIFSATHQQDLNNNYRSFYQQLSFVLIGFVFLGIAALMPFRVIYALAYYIYGITILLLLITLVVHVPGVRGQRWIYIFGFYFQPSEFAKIATVLALARFLSESKVRQNSIRDISLGIGIVLLPVSLIFKQPDLGTCLPFIGMVIPMLFWAGLPYFSTFAMIAPIFSLLVIVYGNPWIFVAWMLLIGLVIYLARRDLFVAMGNYVVNISVGILAPIIWGKLKPYQQKRILTFLDPGLDPRGAGYQVLQSQTAIGSGGLKGKGFLQGTQTQLRFLPEQHTDFVFSVVGEEFGFMGVACCITCFFALLFRGIQIAGAAKNHFASLTAMGLTMVLFVHIFINLGMAVGLMPVTGLPLPFMTSGGSSLLSFMTMVGILSNISVNRMQY